MEFTKSEVLDYYQERVPGLKLLESKELRAPCPIHNGKDLNFAVSADTGTWFCHSQCGRGGDMLALEMELRGMDFVTAKASVFDLVGRPKPTWEDRDVEAIYNYTDANKQVLYQVVRKHGKKFQQRRPDGGGGWHWGLAGVDSVPYRLPELVAAQFCFVVEGERDADNLARLGVAATCNNGGAGNFKPELAQYFTGKQVAILPDFDDPGRKHALSVAAILAPTAASVKIIELSGLKPKGDVSDFLQHGGTLDDIRVLYAKSQKWTPEWQFGNILESEFDKYIHTISGAVQAAGGTDKFWNLAAQEGIATPWPKLTRALGGGLRAGEVYILGGNQGSGKTSAALQFAMEVMRRQLGVLYFSMEMGARDVFQRMASIESMVDLLEFRDLQRTASFSIELGPMKEALVAATEKLAEHRLVVSTKSAVTPEFLLEESSRLRSRSRIDAVIIDHLQLMATTNSVRGDYEKFTAISRTVKQVAVEMDLPVLLVSQTSRNNSTDRRSELEPSDLRGSGALEEDAAGVMLIYPDKQDKETTTANGTFARGPVKTWLKIGKNRYGLQGLYLPMMHFKKCTRFEPCIEDQQ